jgi:serine/threonine-protein kinase
MDIIERVRDQIDSLHAMTRIMSDMTAATESLATNDANYDHTQNPTVTNTFSDLDIVAAQGLGLIPEKPLNQAAESPRLIVGRYYLESFIAQGGHGQVWRAYDPELQRRVALKMTRPERMAKLSAHQRYIEQYRLLEEARKVARLKANGIMTIYDVGIQDPLAFIVCELIDGEDLSHRLRNIKPTFAEAVRLCIEVAEILDIAHQEGFIHRDIKPGNILLEKGGRVVITDFGIAATFNDIDREAGMVVGTPSYMSPEQATGQTDAIATTTDIYSLGVILFEMLTGRLPFENESTPKLLSQIIENDPPKPTSIDPLIPLPLERVCLKALSKTPLDRQHNALEFSDSLRYAALISNIKWEKT